MTLAGHTNRLGRTKLFSDIAAEPHETPHQFLRRATRPWHEATEAAFAPFDLGDRHGLGGFLRVQARAVLALEAALERAGIGDLLPDWAERRRSDALAADLLSLGLPVPSVLPADLPAGADMLGASYVLEGSRLGGRLLRRTVEGSEDPAVRQAVRFLAHDGAAQGWRGFVTVLDQRDLRRDGPALLAGASAAFDLFRTAAAQGHHHSPMMS